MIVTNKQIMKKLKACKGDVLSITDVANLLEISEDDVNNLVEEGELPSPYLTIKTKDSQWFANDLMFFFEG